MILSNSFCQSTISIHAGPVVPLSEFAYRDLFNIKEEAGYAGIGINLGIQIVYPVLDSSLALFGGIDCFFHRYNDEFRKGYERDYPDSEFKWITYFYIPVSAGIHYTYSLSKKLDVFGQGGLSVSFLKLTEFSWDRPGFSHFDRTSKLSDAAGFTVGLGAAINRHLEVGVFYDRWGLHTIKGEVTNGTQTSKAEDLKRRIALLVFRVGYTF